MLKTLSKPKTANELIALLGAAQDDLGKGGRRIASFVLANLGAAAMLSSSEIAERCGVNASSVVRLTQSLGFSGYREFQALLQLCHSETIGFSETMGDVAKLDPGHFRPETQKSLRLYLLIDSGRSFNEAAEAASNQFIAKNPSVEIIAEQHVSYTVDPAGFALPWLDIISSLRSDQLKLTAIANGYTSIMQTSAHQGILQDAVHVVKICINRRSVCLRLNVIEPYLLIIALCNRDWSERGIYRASKAETC